MPSTKFNLTTTWTIIILTYLLAAGAASFYDLGTGFSLTLDYGTASVYVGRIFVDVAKIEGNEEYKAMMRSQDIRDPFVNDYTNSPPPTSDALLETCPQLVQFPSCLKGDQALQEMLRVLKMSVEFYLGHPIDVVGMAVPFPISKAFRDSLRSSGSAISLKIRDSLPAGSAVARRLKGPSVFVTLTLDYCDDYVVLTIDYSRAALTAMMLSSVNEYHTVERIIHEPQLGAESMAKDPDNVRTRMKAALQQLTALPVKLDKCKKFLTYIDKVILFGDAIDDPQLYEVLQEVLDEILYDETFGPSYDRPGHSQVTYEAARAAADECWYHDYRLEMRKYFSCYYG